MLRVKNLSVGYDSSHAVLKNLSFDVPSGETIAVVGLSGCGKSTLLKAISGLLTSFDESDYRNSVTFNGLLVSEILNKGELSFMFQKPKLLPYLTVKRNVEFPLRITGGDKSVVDDIISKIGLSKQSNFLPFKLSGGMKTRVALARSFITNPKLLLLDEPFSSLDVAWKKSLYEQLDELKKLFRTTVILVTHDIEEAIFLTDNQVLVLGMKGEFIGSMSKTKSQLNKEKIENLLVADHQKMPRV